MANSLYKVNESKQLVPINWMPFKQMTKAELKALTEPLPSGTIVNVTDESDIAEIGLKADLPNPTKTIAENIKGFVKKATVSGTTTASGNLASNTNPSSRIVLTAHTNQMSTFAWVGINSSGQWVFHITDSAGETKASTSVSVTYYYIDAGVFAE